jgi:tetratricopeptide (TPR) repeat protein
MPKRRIFVSATNLDLKSYRLRASQSLRKRGYVVDDEAIFDLTFLEIGESLKRRIEQCDAVVCLIGSVYGGEPSNRPPDQPRRSYTQWEYFLARELNKPAYLLLADEDTPFDEHESEDDELRQLQLRYRAEVTRDRDWRAFANVDRLRAELAELRFPWEGPPPDHKPCNLPLVTIGPLFKGRETFLADLRDRLGAPDGRATAIVSRLAVHGLGGVGKTRAAIEYAWRYADEYTALLFVSAASAAELHANLAGLVGVLGTSAETASLDEQLAQVLGWLEANPGWLLIVDNVDTEEAARAIEELLARLQKGYVLITSRISKWSTAVGRLDLDLLAPAAAVAFLLERTPQRRKASDDAVQAATVAHELGGLALALEQAGAYIDALGFSFAEYLRRWEAGRAEVLRWHDPRLVRYPASVAVTWGTTFAQLSVSERRLLEILSWLAPDPIPLILFDAAPLAEAIPRPREALAGLQRFSLARFDVAGDAVLVHRLVQEITKGRLKPSSWVHWLVHMITRGRIPAADRTATLQVALKAVSAVTPGVVSDFRSWAVWTPLVAHAEAVSRYADDAGLAEPTARLMNQLGLYWRARGQFRAAEPLLRRALAIDERSRGPDHPDVARDLNNLAMLLKSTGRLAEAEPLMRRTLAMVERSHGPDHPDVAIRLNNLALLLQDTGRLAEAEPLVRRALAIDERSRGPDHPVVAIRLNTLAVLLQNTGRLAEAEPLVRRALAIDERSRGPDHPDVARDLNNLAGLLQATDRPAEAEPLYRRVVEILEASLGSDERSRGPDHPNLATALNNLAVVLKATGRPAEAEPLYRRALAIDERSLGPDHPVVATRLNNLALLLQDTDRPAEAEPLSKRGVQILIEFRRTTGHEHPKLQVALANYYGLLEASGKTPDEIKRQVIELVDSPGSEGS